MKSRLSLDRLAGPDKEMAVLVAEDGQVLHVPRYLLTKTAQGGDLLTTIIARDLRCTRKLIEETRLIQAELAHWAVLSVPTVRLLEARRGNLDSWRVVLEHLVPELAERNLPRGNGSRRAAGDDVERAGDRDRERIEANSKTRTHRNRRTTTDQYAGAE